MANELTEERKGELDLKAQKLNDTLKADVEGSGWSGWPDDVIAAKKACQAFLDQALEMRPEEQLYALTRAQQINDATRAGNSSELRRMPALNIVFGDLNKDGKRLELSDFKMSYTHNKKSNSEYAEVVDLYDP